MHLRVIPAKLAINSLKIKPAAWHFTSKFAISPFSGFCNFAITKRLLALAMSYQCHSFRTFHCGKFSVCCHNCQGSFANVCCPLSFQFGRNFVRNPNSRRLRRPVKIRQFSFLKFSHFKWSVNWRVKQPFPLTVHAKAFFSDSSLVSVPMQSQMRSSCYPARSNNSLWFFGDLHQKDAVAGLNAFCIATTPACNDSFSRQSFSAGFSEVFPMPTFRIPS